VSAAPRSRLLQWKESRVDHGWGTRPDDLDFGCIEATMRRLRPIFGGGRAYFPTTVTGWENLPDPGALLIANHSGGTVIPDVWGLGMAWYGQHGADRPVHALAHEMVFALDGTARFFAKRGILRATREAARTILVDHQRDLLVLPGGDLDTWRPWKDRYKVNFAGRKGYARVALQTGAPVVPVAHAGAHDTLIVLDDGERIARLLRFPELFRANIFPVHLSFPYGVGIGPWPHLPPPTRLRYRIGKPVVPEALPPGAAPTPEQIDALDRQVRAALQLELDVLRDEADGVLDRVEFLARKARARVRRIRTERLEPMVLAAR
jgi:1-acyl-sn-glycerol-3-phosphate acyltransferase